MARRTDNDMRQLFEAVGTMLGNCGSREDLLVLLPVGPGGQVWCGFVPRRTVAKSLARSMKTAMRLLQATPERMRAVYFGAKQVLLATEDGTRRLAH